MIEADGSCKRCGRAAPVQQVWLAQCASYTNRRVVSAKVAKADDLFIDNIGYYEDTVTATAAELKQLGYCRDVISPSGFCLMCSTEILERLMDLQDDPGFVHGQVHARGVSALTIGLTLSDFMKRGLAKS